MGSAPRFLEPQTDCGACLRALDDLGWPASTTLRVGEWALGVRSSDTETDAVLRRVLGAHVVDVEAPANFSMLMADDDTRAFDLLYRANDILVRTRAHGRVLRTLLAHLSLFVEPAPSGAIRLDATALIADGRAIVVADDLREHLQQIETRLNVAGIAVTDAPELHLESGGAAVVVPELALTIDADALAEYELAYPPGERELPAVLPGRYPISAWAFGIGFGQDGPVSAAQGVAAVAQQIVNVDEIGAAESLDGVAAAMTGVPVVGMRWFEPGGLFTQLRDLAGRHEP